MVPRRTDLGIVVLIKAFACAMALALGFRAVSDDDFARVTIAQTFARMPVFDASGTSWLPFPFWITGSTMLVVGRSWLVARVVAFALGLVSAALVGVAAYRLTNHRHGALLGAIFAAIFPWSVRLGVATVPELLTAALGIVALASLADTSVRFRCVGGAALFGATLSRYDVWPIAAAFAVLTGVDILRWEKPSVRQRFFLGAAIVLALAGPSLWIVWNHLSRGNAFDFLDRVAAYRRAVGTPDDAPLARLFAYPLAMLRHEPEIFGGLAILLMLGQTTVLRPHLRDAWTLYRRPFWVAFLQMGLLSLAMIKDGAPTHHPERALLVMLLLCALFVGNLAAILVPRASRNLRVLAAGAALGVLILSLVIVRRWFRGEDFAVRQDEVATGSFARQTLPQGERILVDVVDYGYFAFLAAWGRPEDAVLDRDLDPRKQKLRSSFEDRALLLRRIDEAHVRWIVGSLSSPAVKTLGPPQFVHGQFGVWHEEAWR